MKIQHFLLVAAAAIVASCNQGTSGTTTITGDVTGDGSVDLTDYIRLLKYLSDQTVEIRKEATDLDGDGTISLTDAVTLQKMILEENES